MMHIYAWLCHIAYCLGSRPKPIPARIASSVTRVILEVIRAGVGLGLD